MKYGKSNEVARLQQQIPRQHWEKWATRQDHSPDMAIFLSRRGLFRKDERKVKFEEVRDGRD